MLKKYSIPIGIITSLFFLVVAAMHYPGGSQFDKNSIGYDWQKNYISNLFSPLAVNGADNAARPWAVGGMFLLSISFALFFIEFSKKIPVKSASGVIRYCGVGAMVGAFLAVTPFHDTMVTVAGTLALLSIFYVTVYVLKSKLHFFKILSIVCLLVFYSCNFMYYSSSYLKFLPIMQKTLLVLTITWMLGLEYFSKKEDFEQVKLAKTGSEQ